MSWYDPSSWSIRDLGLLGGVTGGLLTGSPALKDAYNGLTTSPDAEAEAIRKKNLYNNASQARTFARQGERSYNELGGLGTGALAALQAQAQGQNSVSAEQLRQGAAQGIAAQRSLAAGAAPQNAAAAARTAAIQSARLTSGLAGQQAVAGLQERNQAQQQYGNLLQGLRGQDLNAAIQSRQNALTGYSAGNVGAPEKSDLEKLGGLVQAGASIATKSDRNAKTDIKDGTSAAESALRGLSAHVYKYKDEADGKGARLGIMAQDLESAGLGHAVMKGPDGAKMVHGGHLATSLAAMMPGLDKRLSKLEGKER